MRTIEQLQEENEQLKLEKDNLAERFNLVVAWQQRAANLISSNQHKLGTPALELLDDEPGGNH